MRKNSKGFTILEVIIAISILNVVIFIGYEVINSSRKAMYSQNHITKSQLSTNLVNEYVTKDIEVLEAKKYIQFKNNGVIIDKENKKYTQNYTYTIDAINNDENGKIVDIVEYEVKHVGEINNDKINGVYSVNRRSKEKVDNEYSIISDLELISNQETEYTNNSGMSVEKFLTSSIKPFAINKNNIDMNLYTVDVYYQNNNKEKKYVFDVSPRMSVGNTEVKPPVNPEPPTEPEVDPDFDGNSAYIRFKQDGGLAWSDAGPKGHSGNNYEGQKIGKEEVYKIEAKISAGDSAGFAEAFLDDKNSYSSAQNKYDFPKGNYNQIKISLFGGVTLENLTIKVNYKSNIAYEPIEDKTINNTQIIIIDETNEGKDQSEIIVTGNMRLKEGSNYGDIIINLGHSK